MAEGSGQKVCTGCGLDVTDKPRQKDPQGRYFCQACAAKAQAAAKSPGTSKPQAAAPGKGAPIEVDDPAMAALFEASGKKKVGGGVVPCPSCGVGIAESAAICTSCGFNIATGKSLKTRFKVENVGGGEDTGPKTDFKLPISWDVVAGIMLGLILLSGVWAAVHPTGLIAFYIALGLNSVVCYIMLLVIPFQDKQNGWGLFNVGWPFAVYALGSAKMILPAALLVLIAPVAILYYVFAVNWRDSLKRLYIAGFVGVIMFAVIVGLHGKDRIAESFGIDPKELDSDSAETSPQTTPGKSSPGK